MPEIAGKLAEVYVLAGVTAMTGSTGAKLQGMDSSGLSQMAEMLDITQFGDSFKRRMPGIKDTDISTSGNLYSGDTTGQAILQTAYDNGTTVFVGIYPQGTGVAGKQVQCYVEGLETKASATGKVTFTPKFSAIAAPEALPLRP